MLPKLKNTNIFENKKFLNEIAQIRTEPLPVWPILDAADVTAGLEILKRCSDPKQAAKHLEPYNTGGIVEEFEEYCVDYFGESKFCIATSSGYGALLISFLALDLKPEDEVIVPMLCYGQAISPLIHLGVKIVFADVELGSMNICPIDIEKKITSNTKAILAVHVNGNPCDMDKINLLTEKHKLFLVEDACQALGAQYQNKLVGQFGVSGCFSTGSPKQLSVGTGGFILTSDEKFYLQCKAKGFRYNKILDHPDTPGLYVDSISYTNDACPFSAALAKSRLGSLADRNRQILKNVNYFKEKFNKSRVSFILPPQDGESVYFKLCLRLNLEKLPSLSNKDVVSLLNDHSNIKLGEDLGHALYPLNKTQRIIDLYGAGDEYPNSSILHREIIVFRSIHWYTDNCEPLIDQYAKVLNTLFDYFE